MHCRLTRTERLPTRFELALAPALLLALGCSSVELVGVDRATVLMTDARAAAPSLDTSVRDADTFDAAAAAAGPVRASDDAGDSGALAVWSDPERPAPLPGQFVEPSRSCPAIEPTAEARCELAGQQCDYPVCWGRGSRSWVCVDQRFALWFDESFLCADSRPCPASSPSQGAVCSLSIECVYPFFCCKGPTGFQSAVCAGRWSLGEPECAGCIAPP